MTIHSESTRHYNHPGRSEAEILRLSGTEQLLATSTFGMQAELQEGIYKEPYLIGWLIVVPGVKKILATGAMPEFASIHVRCKQPFLSDPIYLDLLQNGIMDAARQSKIQISDLEMGEAGISYFRSHFLGKTIGNTWIGKEKCTAGDKVYASGKMGSGNLYAYQSIGGEKKKHPFKPMPNIELAKLIRTYASACRITSYGFFRTVAELAMANNCGMHVELPIDTMLNDSIATLTRKKEFTDGYFLKAPHGEYEYIFTIPADLETDFLKKTDHLPAKPILLGSIVEENRISYTQGLKTKTISPGSLLKQCSEIQKPIS